MIHLKGFETFFENKKEITCGFYNNLKPSPNKEPFFKNLTPDKKKKVIQEATNIMIEYRKQLIGWYKNPDTIKKFDDEVGVSDCLTFFPQLISHVFTKEKDSGTWVGDDVDAVRKDWSQQVRVGLDSWINSLKCVIHFNKSTSGSPDVWGYYTPGGRKIYVNLYQFYSDDKSGRENLVNVIRHEMTHAIDDYLKYYELQTYEPTHNLPKDQAEYNKIYNINDKDQFARLQNFRFKFGIKPIDNAKSIGDKLIKAYKTGRLKSDAWKFDLYSEIGKTYFVFIPKETKVVYTPDVLKQAFMFFDKEKEMKNPVKTNLQGDKTRVDKSNITKIKQQREEVDTYKHLRNKKNNLEKANYLYDVLYFPTDHNVYNKPIKDRFVVDEANDFESLQLFSNFSKLGRCYDPKRYIYDTLVFVDLDQLTEFNNTTVKVDNKEDISSKTA
jgi:hypothetical protein